MVDQTTVEYLEEALAEAKAGRLRKVLIIGERDGGSIISWLTEVQWLNVVSYMERLKFRIMQDLPDLSEDE